jgi:glycerol-3-phosphate dehydrogenase
MVTEAPDIVGQVIFAARHDWCRTVEDFMLRRSDLGLRPDRTLHAAPHVADWLASELEWPAGRAAQQVEAYRARVATDTRG